METAINESSTAKVYWTKEYGTFKFLHGNRDLNPSKVKKLMKDVEEGLNLFQYCPILVSEGMYIIDGQHRFYVCKKMKLNVYFMIVPNLSLGQIAKVNNNQNRWRMDDFLNCYIDAGKNSADYKALKEFKEKYGINISLAVNLLFTGKGISSHTSLEAFRNGLFESKYLLKACELMEMVTDYDAYSGITRDRDFIVAVEKLIAGGKFNHQEMLNKLKKHQLFIEKRSTAKEYLIQMEELFNFRNSIRITIY